MEKEWYYRTRQREHGPISTQELRRLIDNGMILPDTLIRRRVTGQWIRASELDESPNRSPSRAQTAQAPEVTPSTRHTERTVVETPQVLDGGTRSPNALFMILGGSLTGIAIVALIVAVVKLNQPGEPTVDQTTPATETVEPAGTGVPDAKPEPVAETIVATPVEPEIKLVEPEAIAPPKLLSTEEVVSQSEASVALLKGRLSSGTGFLATPKLLVTNKHVISEELISDVKVHFPSAPETSRGPFSVKLLYEDESLDLAFLQIETTLPALTLAEKYRFRRGQEVIVIGNPGLHGDVVLQNAVSKGVMSSEATIRGQSYYQLGIAINSGNSGGPVFDSYGQVIGVVTLKASRKEGLGFCIPSPQVSLAIEKANGMSAKEIEVAESLHRIRTVFTLTVAMGQEYKAGMSFLTKVMQAARTRGGVAPGGINAIQEKVQEKLAAYDQVLLSQLTTAVSKISRDANLSNQIRQQFIELWGNYVELKSYVDHPRGSHAAYQTKFVELSDKHDRLTESLRLLLGVEISE